MRLTGAIVEMLQGRLPPKTLDGNDAKFVLPLDSPLLLGTDIQTEAIPLLAASVRQQIKSTALFVQAIAIIAGPIADGVTGNTSVLFVGGPSVAPSSGFPLTSGAILTLGFVNIQSIWFVGATAGDTLRVVYVT